MFTSTKEMNMNKATFTATDLPSNLHFACKATRQPVKKPCPWKHVELNREIKIEFKIK